jgi:hypothetical protein
MAYLERLLSRHIVYFAAEELVWEGSQLHNCECVQGDAVEQSRFVHMPRNRLHDQNAPDGSSSDAVEQYWIDIIHTYSALGLSMERDKLPALSAFAKQILKLRPGDECLAGLWRSTIISGLGWRRWVLTTEDRPTIEALPGAGRRSTLQSTSRPAARKATAITPDVLTSPLRWLAQIQQVQ